MFDIFFNSFYCVCILIMFLKFYFLSTFKISYLYD